jgi:hypothetical protein
MQLFLIMFDFGYFVWKVVLLAFQEKCVCF